MQWYVLWTPGDSTGDEYEVLGEVNADTESEALTEAAQYYEKPKESLKVEQK